MAKFRSLSVFPSVCKSPGFHYYIHHNHKLAPVLLSDILVAELAEAVGHDIAHHAGQPGPPPHPGNIDHQVAEPGARLQLHSGPGHQDRTDQANCILKRSNLVDQTHQS